MYYVGRVLCAPCNAKCWGACCRGCGECLTCGGCCCPEDKPSPLFLGFTILLNLCPGVAFVVLGLINVHNHCNTYVPVFFYVTAALNVFFLAFAIHIYAYFSRPYNARQEPDTGPMARACHVFWNDPWVAFFVLFFIGAFVWAIVGFATFASADCGDSSSKGHYLPKAASICAALLLVYVLGSLFMIVLSLMLECVRRAPISNSSSQSGRSNYTPQSILSCLLFPKQRPQVAHVPPNTYIPQTSAPPPISQMVRPAPPPGYANPPPAYANPYVSPPVQMGYPVQNVYTPPPAKLTPNSPPQKQTSSSYATQPAPYGTQPAPSSSQSAPYAARPTAYTAPPPPPGYVPYDQLHTPSGSKRGDAGPSESAPSRETTADKAVALGKLFAGTVGTGLKKLGEFVEEKANSHATGSGQSSKT